MRTRASMRTGATGMVTLLCATGATMGMLAAMATPADAEVKPDDLKKTYRLDMDGDGRLDDVTVTVNNPGGNPSWDIAVRTARNLSARTRFTPPNLLTAVVLGAVGGPLTAWGDLDGVPGNELFLVSGFLPRGGGASQRVISWKAGKLVQEKLPVPGGDWSVEGENPRRSGYMVWTKNHVRYASVLASGKDRSGRFVGTTTTYSFTKGAWRKVGSPRAVRLTDAQTRPYVKRAGLKLTILTGR